LLVLVDERQVERKDEQQRGQRHEGDDGLREPAPNAEIHFHTRSLTPGAANVKADSAKNAETRIIWNARSKFTAPQFF